MNRLFFIIIITIFTFTTSCRKKYYNCTCSYLNEYEEIDTLIISVRTNNRSNADKACADAEIEIAVDEDWYAFCQLQ